jgi:hypothetical protein
MAGGGLLLIEVATHAAKLTALTGKNNCFHLIRGFSDYTDFVDSFLAAIKVAQAAQIEW